MNDISAIKDAEELKEPNIGFRFLFDPKQAQSGAVLFLQWCLAPQVIQHLKDNGVTDAKVFITMRNPHGRETRYVASLASPQEFLEFHCSGKHEITGTVVWGDHLKYAGKQFLEKCSRRDYEFGVEKVLTRSECSSFGKAEMSVEVPSGYFAPEMSPWMSWYVNLWHGEPAWDECETRRRTLIAFTIQTAALAVWIPIISLMRLVYAMFIGGILLRKDVPWEAIVQPFAYELADIWDKSNRRWEEEPIKRLMLVPANQLMIILFSLAVCTGPDDVKWFLINSGIVYVAIMAFFVILNSAVLEKFVGDWKRRAREREERLLADSLNRSYAELLCTTAPADGTLRTKRQGFKNNVVLAFQDFKARVCRPTALH